MRRVLQWPEPRTRNSARDEGPLACNSAARMLVWREPLLRDYLTACGNTEFEPTFWLAGDAAMALDPLSGQEVYEAVRGA